MTAGTLWTKHRRLATGIASRYRIPGQDADDTRQDALVALWEAARAWDGEGEFAVFATVVVRRRLIDRLKHETRLKRCTETVELEDVAAPDTRPGREQLQLTLDTLPSLTALERSAVAGKLNGTYDSHDKTQDNALTSARRKLRAA